MKIDRLSTLLPCSSLEDLRLDRNLDECEELLSAWSALWHPALIAGAQAVPGWYPAAQPPLEPAGSLIVLPECCEPLLPDGWPAKAEASGALLLRKLKHRPEMVQAALERLGCDPAAIDPHLAADFLALGFCRFVVEVLTQKFRYMSNIDETALRAAVLAAAKAAVQGDVAEARRELQSAFDRLHEAREYFYPVETRLIDFTLAASTTLGESLLTDLTAGLPRNLLISAEVLQDMALREPATLAALKKVLADNSVSIVGGEFAEVPLPLLHPDAVEFHLRRGLEVYKHILDRRPAVFGRRRFGLNPALPQILAKTGFTAAVHFTLDDGQFPAGNQSCIQWEGFDGTSVDALAKIPLDADRADSFFRLPEHLGNAMELDQPATVVFAHWPGRVCHWYDDLTRIFSYSRALGAFYTLDDYFRQAEPAGRRVKYNADQYRLPYLAQDVAANLPDSISRWVHYYRRRSLWESAQTLYALAALTLKKETACGFATDFQKILAIIEDSLIPNTPTPPNPELDQLLQQTLHSALQRFSESLVGNTSSPHTPCAGQAHNVGMEVVLPSRGDSATVAPTKGYLLANPCSFSQRLGVNLPRLDAPPDVADPVRAAENGKAVVDLPGMGFAWIGLGAEKQPSPESGWKRAWLFGKKHKIAPPLAEENTLRNEFFEAIIDPHTGAIRAISDYRGRHPRLAQQIALRMSHAGEQDPAGDVPYSIMSADEIHITSPGPVLGEIVSSGKISDRKGCRLAGFKQTARTWSGSRVLELEIELDIDRQPGPNPWNSYYACRFAWSDETSKLFRGVNLTTQPTELTRLESPHFIDVRTDSLRTTILCAGLPYHRRIGPRKLDTLLIVQGETARRFRLGVGIDLPNAMTAALGFLAPKTIYFPSASPPMKHGWLFHLDHRNVIATRWEPIFMSPLPLEDSPIKSPLPLGEGQGEGRVARDDNRVQGSGFRVQDSGFGVQGSTPSADIRPPASGLRPVIGFRVRLLETEGHHARLSIRCFRPIASARMIDVNNPSPMALSIEGDRIIVPVEPYKMIDVEAVFTGQPAAITP
jgi:alpha-mannosidase